MKVLVVEPLKKPYTKDIDPGLQSLQHEVGGYIEAIYPFEEKVGLICNEEGKMDGLPLNRAIYGESGEIFDIIAGTFLIAGLSEDNFDSLPDELADKFGKLFESPEEFYSINGQIQVQKVEPLPDSKPTPAEAWREEFRAAQNCAKDLAGNGALSRAYHERKLGAFLSEMIEKHGAKRFELVLANTINNAERDGRYSPIVRKWATEIKPFPQYPENEGEPRKFYELTANEHPAIINELARKLIDTERQKQAYKVEQVR